MWNISFEVKSRGKCVFWTEICPPTLQSSVQSTHMDLFEVSCRKIEIKICFSHIVNDFDDTGNNAKIFTLESIVALKWNKNSRLLKLLLQLVNRFIGRVV